MQLRGSCWKLISPPKKKKTSRDEFCATKTPPPGSSDPSHPTKKKNPSNWATCVNVHAILEVKQKTSGLVVFFFKIQLNKFFWMPKGTYRPLGCKIATPTGLGSHPILPYSHPSIPLDRLLRLLRLLRFLRHLGTLWGAAGGTAFSFVLQRRCR